MSSPHPCAGLEDSKQYRFRVRPVFEPADEERGGDEWGWSPASALASPAVLNAFLASQIPEELVVRGKKTVNRTVLAGKIVGKDTCRMESGLMLLDSGSLSGAVVVYLQIQYVPLALGELFARKELNNCA